MFSLYTEPGAFADFCDDDICKNWRDIIGNGVDVFVNISEGDLQYELEQPDSPIFLFYMSIANGKEAIAINNYFTDLKKDFTLLEAHPFDSFILDIPLTDAIELKESYGVEVYSENSLKDFEGLNKTWVDVLQGSESKCEKSGQQGWRMVLENCGNHISNSLIITDRNLFTNEDNRGLNLGIYNLVEFLDNFISDNLKISYQVLIVTQLPKKLEREDKLKTFIKELNDKVSQLSNGLIEVEILFIHPSMKTYTFTHARRLLTNYHFGIAQHGFSMFKMNGTVRVDNDFTLENCFVRFNKSINYLIRLRDIKLDAEKKLKSQGQNNRFFRLFSNEDETFTIKNRLLN